MDIKIKKRLFWFVGILALLAVAYFTVNYTVKSKLEDGFKNLPKTVKIEYEAMHVNTLTGNVKLVKPTFLVYGKTTDSINLKATLQELSIKGFSYWQYFLNDKIAVNHIVFTAPNITYYHNNLVKSKSYKSPFSKDLQHAVAIESLEVLDGKIAVYRVSNDSLSLKSNAVYFKIENIVLDKNKNASALAYSSFSAKSNHLFYRLSAYENLFIDAVDVNSDTSKLKGLKMKTKYSKTELSDHLSEERDHFDLTIDSLMVENQDFGFKQDSLFYFKAPKVAIYNTKLDVYRDKLLPDDPTYKPLYSKMLRELNLDLGLDNVLIDNAKITYTEKVKANTKGGELVFSNLSAEIKNLGNAYSEKTLADINALFMGITPLKVQWHFNVNDINDAFVFKSEIDALKADNLNQYTKPNLNVKLEGELTKLYFTVSGNDQTSRIDTKLKYDNFDVVILKKNGKEKNKFLSTVLNIFISEDSRGDADKFSYGSKQGLERDTTKSVFNYVWINLKAGLSNAITGSGKKGD